MVEEWRIIPSFPDYAISNEGIVKRIVASRITKVSTIMKQHMAGRGYMMISLRLDGVSYRRTIHSLVAEAFIGPRPEGKEINHINGIKTDNRPANLEYVTHRENIDHSLFTGLKPGVKLNWEKVAQIRKLSNTGWTGREIATEFNVSTASVSLVINEKIWREEIQ